ncbi:TrkH family potassium uptake protein, partial [bacterium]|nr:TrkH family potassium uptake protein [bacterium]
MNYRMLGYVLGRIFMVEAALMLLPVAVALIYGETGRLAAFLIPLVLLAVIGLLLGKRAPADTAIYACEGLVIVALSWVLMSVFGALPFVISGEIPNFVDAFFETVSGFTTTGASILPEVEKLSHGILYWRSFSHW